jgi:1-deoxy-D-xylulose-5-phosphate reductoisomerase
MNAANEAAVAGFLDGQVRFPDIWQIVGEVMNRHTSVAHPDLDAILKADQWARKEARGMLDR